MKSLEHKIPPPLLLLVVLLLMWGGSKFLPLLAMERQWHIALTASAGLFALAFGASGIATFRRAQTTIDPVHIDQASRVVTTGISRITRNPMYVGLTALLIAWALYLAVPWTLVGPVAFAIFIHRFQILPEERAMANRFSDEYSSYQRRVRRWL